MVKLIVNFIVSRGCFPYIFFITWKYLFLRLVYHEKNLQELVPHDISEYES